MRNRIAALLIGLGLQNAFAQEIPFNPENYICYRTHAPLNINGNITEADWQQAHWTSYFVDIEGSIKPAPRYKTRVKMLWDDTYFYFAADMEEPHVWGTITDRDAVIFQDNDFEIFIDPDGDTHQYYEFEMNALNTIWDLLLIAPYRDMDRSVLNSWDIRGIKTAVQVKGTLNDPTDEDQGWTVEIAMPWKVLREQAFEQRRPKHQEHWRVDFSRVEWQSEIIDGKYRRKINPKTQKPFPEDNWVWSPQGVVNMHRPETWGYVQFSDYKAGDQEDTFVDNPGEKTKWTLRQLYFAQQAYLEKYQSYAGDLKTLQPLIGADYVQALKGVTIQMAGKDRYTASLNSEGAIWKIREDGKVWRDAKK